MQFFSQKHVHGVLSHFSHPNKFMTSSKIVKKQNVWHGWILSFKIKKLPLKTDLKCSFQRLISVSDKLVLIITLPFWKIRLIRRCQSIGSEILIRNYMAAKWSWLLLGLKIGFIALEKFLKWHKIKSNLKIAKSCFWSTQKNVIFSLEMLCF